MRWALPFPLLLAAASPVRDMSARVCRGYRPQLCGKAIAQCCSPDTAPVSTGKCTFFLRLRWLRNRGLNIP